MKKFIATLCFLLVFTAGIFCVTADTQAAEYERVTTKKQTDKWTDGTNSIYINKAGTKLYMKKAGEKATLLKNLKADDVASYWIVNVTGNVVYIQKIKDSDPSVYAYNLKKNTYKQIKKDCYVCAASGKFMVTTEYTPSDITPFPGYVYKCQANKLKKISKLGEDISQPFFMDGKLYYASYTDGNVQKMDVYVSGKNGKNASLLFTRAASGDDGYVLLEDGADGKINYCVNETVDAERLYGIYDVETNKAEETKKN